MSLVTLATIVFFLAYGVSHFYPFKHSDKVSAVAAIVIGVMMLLKL